MRTGYGLWNAEHGSAVMGSDREDHPEQRRGVDLRRSPRHRLVLPVDLAFENETSNALVLDLSENGCLIEAERRIELGETLQIEFYENPELRYKAKIIWGGDALYGCQFFQPIPETIVEEARLWTVPRLIGEAIDGASADQLPIAIRAARSSAGLSAAELARRAGVSRPTLWSWETGKSRPTKGTWPISSRPCKWKWATVQGAPKTTNRSGRFSHRSTRSSSAIVSRWQTNSASRPAVSRSASRSIERDAASRRSGAPSPPSAPFNCPSRIAGSSGSAGR
ncbi:PilZ domain-containing protein [Qipengyuania citrea]|uniref:PilZ domain-containing protein n=1 Tax=Qipengyuania citrea TaxID=225971 RepID=UPI003D6638B7